MLRFATVMACALMLTGCASAPATPARPPGVPIKLTEAQIRAVHEGVKRGLKDPNSANLRDISAVDQGSHGIVVCGMVNAKNVYGGYVGDKPFFGILTTGTPPGFVAIGFGGTEVDTFVATKSCREAGINVF